MTTTEVSREGRETRLDRDSEYLLNEQEAMAQRILKWQKEEVTELESEWSVDNHGKQLLEVSETRHSLSSPENNQSQLSSVPYEKQIPTEPSLASFKTAYAVEVQDDVRVRLSNEAIQSVHIQNRETVASPVQTTPLAFFKTAYGVEVQEDGRAILSNEAMPPVSVQKTETVSSPAQALTHKSDLLTEGTTAKEAMNREALILQKPSPAPKVCTLPAEEHQIAASAKPFRQSAPAAKEAEVERSNEEYVMLVDKASLQHFQYEVKEENRTKEGVEPSRDETQRRLQKNVASEVIQNVVVKESDPAHSKNDTKIPLPESTHSVESMVFIEKSGKNGRCPVCVKELSSLKVNVGEMSELCCQFQGEPVPTVSWLKDGQPLDHNPDYDVVTKSNYSKLTVFYPTTDHVGTYECVLANKYGKHISKATLEISDVKVMATLEREQEVVITREVEETNTVRARDDEVSAYMDTRMSTLQVPQVVVQKRQSNDSFSSSPVEIRITAATPVPEMVSEVREDYRPTEKGSDLSTDDSASQIKHKFTFSFDVAAEAPNVVRELENIICTDGNTAMLECVISGEPTPEVTWYFDDVCIGSALDKYMMEVEEKTHRLYIQEFANSDAGVYKCVATNKLGEVSSISNVSRQAAEQVQLSKDDQFVTVEERVRGSLSHDKITADKSTSDLNFVKFEEKAVPSKLDSSHTTSKSKQTLSRESQGLSGCGLASSAAVINVSQIKQAFESDTKAGSMAPPSDEQEKQIVFPKEFLPEVLEFTNQQNPLTRVEHALVSEDGSILFEENVPLPLASFTAEEGSRLEIHGPPQFLDQVQDSPDIVRPKAQKAGVLPEQIQTGVTDMGEEVARTFERTSSFIPFQQDKVPASRSSVKTSVTSGDTVKPKTTSEPIKPERQKLSAISLKQSMTVNKEMEVPTSLESHLEEMDETGISGEHKELDYPLVPIPEPSMESGVFLSLPESEMDVTDSLEVLGHEDVKEEDVGSCVTAQSQKTPIKRDANSLEEQPQKLVEEDLPRTMEAEAAFADGDKETVTSVKEENRKSTTKHGIESMIEESSERETIVDTDKEVKSMQSTGDLDMTSSFEARAALKTAQSLEEEEVTFGAVYDYYNPPTDWGRPLSPESEMSIEIGSTVSEEIAEVAERFFTPGSSTETSQQIADSFQTHKSPISLNTPTSGSPGGFMTPQEHPFSPLGYKRPSTGSSTDNFFSPIQYLPSPADSSHSEITLEETRYLSGRSSLGLGSLQEKVQGIPPAFLKPLIKKRVFENDTLRFYAEVFGLPSPDVKWFCNKSELVENSRIKIDRDGDSISLTINNVTKADQGEYICEALNYVGEARSVALVVVVSQEIRFMPAPPAVTHQHVMEFDVEEDDSSRSPSPQEILLEVELDEKDVKEFEKQVKIITIPEYTADNKSMIISLDVLPSIYEEGTVDFVTQEHDDLKIAFEVTEMPPRFINPICDMEAHEGTTVMFECSLMGIPSPIVSWFKGDKKIPHNKKFNLTSDGDNHFLKICKISSQDSGVYTCRAINVVGETLCRASLVVLSAKAFAGKTRGRELTAVSLGSAKVQPQKFDLMVGNASFDGEQVSEIELEFEFEQEADESQRAVRLVANTDKEISEQGEKYVSINFDVFAEPAKDEKIEFKGKSSEMCSFHFQVTETAPKCVIPLTNVTAAVSTPVILQCLVSGKPNPTAEWYKDGELVTDSRCIIQEKTAGHFNLLITNVTQSDAGEYKCLIQNSAGSIETSALLKVF